MDLELNSAHLTLVTADFPSRSITLTPQRYANVEKGKYTRYTIHDTPSTSLSLSPDIKSEKGKDKKE